MTTATATTAAEPQKRGPGRPPKAKVGNPAERIPPAPTPRPTPDVFWDYWQEIEKQYPNRAVAYLYRGEPKIDRERLGKPKYIHSGNFFTREWLIDRWQSGDYLIILNDPYAPKAQQKLAEVIVRVNDPTRPPVIEDLRELVLEYPGNAEYIAKLRLQGIQLPGDSNDMQAQLAEIREAVRRPEAPPAPLIGNEIITSTVATLLQNNLDPARQMAMWREVIAMANRPAADNLNPVLSVMQAMLAQQQEQFREMITVLRQPQAPPAAPAVPVEDPILTKIKERVLEKVVDQIENPTAPNADAMPAWLPMVMPMAARAIDLFSEFLSHRPAAVAPAVPPNYPVVPMTLHPPPAAPAPPTLMQQQPPPAPPAPNPSTTGEAPPMFDQAKAAMILNAIRPVLVQHLNAGASGMQFRDAITHQFGHAVYDAIRQQPHAAAGIVRALEADAQIGPVAKANPERMRLFVEEFLSDEEEEDDDGE